jgi:hypothetical protein
LCTAGQDAGTLCFEVEAVSEHIQFYLKCLSLYLGSRIPLGVSIIDLCRPETDRERIISDMMKKLGEESEVRDVKIETRINPAEGRGYYKGIRFHIYTISEQGNELELVDGGDTDWTQKLLGNAKERLVISGIGTERLCENFRVLRQEITSTKK